MANLFVQAELFDRVHHRPVFVAFFPGENQFQVRHFVYDAAKGFNQTQMIFVRPELGRIKQEFWRQLQPEASGLEIFVTLPRPELPLRRSRHHDDALFGQGKGRYDISLHILRFADDAPGPLQQAGVDLMAPYSLP